ncbi:MAG: TlpA family protein disulfide reductase [Bacteroidota bacterium]|nr:TlpA family protein disulfide reductase [Bacteroidota bacterium]
MKKTITLMAVILVASFNSFAQFKLSGRVINFKGVDSITLNIPLVYGNYSENDTRIAISKQGEFDSEIALTTQKFATLRYKNLMTTVLLSPGKSLGLLIDSAGKIISFSGTTAKENELLYQSKLNEPPFFLQGDYKTNPYAKLSPADLQEKLVKPWFSIRDENIARVHKSTLNENDKQLIESEIYYQAYTELNYFAHGVMSTDKKMVSEFILANFDGLQPEPKIFPAGPWYYNFVETYISYLDTRIFIQYEPTDARSKEAFLKVYHMSLDSALAVVKRNGKSYIHWYLMKQYFSKSVAERYLAQTIWKECGEKDISHVTPLMNDFKSNFPASTYMPVLQLKVNALELSGKQNEQLKNIDVFASYEKVKSIYEVVNAFKGKVIYLDVWGTWCGPCKRELTFNPRLKQHFKDKDVVFVYLDMDADEKDADWKKFIRLNGITGTHLRKSNTEIQQFWEELLPGKKERLYPSYFIFDKNGKLVQADTKQPSDGEELYTEIEKYL